MSWTQASELAVGDQASAAHRHVAAQDEVMPDDDASSPSATASSWIGVIGLVVTLFLPWGAIACAGALLLGIVSRPRDAYGRLNRIVGLVAGTAGLIFAALWILAATQHVANTAA